MELNVLYVFGGEKASGAEKVIDRLITNNQSSVNAHLLISPGEFAQKLINSSTSYKNITTADKLRKLNRSQLSGAGFYFKAIKNYFSISCLVCRYISRHNIQIVHANTVVPASYLLPAVFWLRLFKPQVKFTWSDHDLKYFSGIDNKLAGLCLRFYDLTLTVSNAVKNKYGTVYQHKIKTLYNGLNINEFKADAIARQTFRAANTISDDEIVLALVGTIEPRKGQLSLVNAFKKLSGKYTNTRLLIAGPLSNDHPEYADEVIEKITESPNIDYLGVVTDMLTFYNGCDIIINNSSVIGGEPLGTTIYEAMATGKVVLASATGGSAEIITDDIDGFIFTPDDEDALLNKLGYVLDNFSTIKPLNNQAVKKVAEEFEISIMTKKYNALLYNLIDKHS